MRRWILASCPLIVLFILSSYGFKPFSVGVPDQLKVKESMLVSYPQEEAILANYQITPPFLGSRFIGFKEALAFKESQGNYFVTNTFGYLGKYQFGLGTLELVGVNDGNHFLYNPVLQEKVFQVNTSRNKWILRKDIKRYVGVRMNGIQITESGILAAAHLAGPGNVKLYLRSHGRLELSDGYGTSISNYMKKFAGYDVSMVEAKRNPRI